MKVMINHYGASFILSKFNNRSNYAVKWRNSRNNHLFSKKVLYIGFSS